MDDHFVIKTTRIHPSVSERALELYFKKWQSEGCTVIDVYMDKEEEAASVHFKGRNLKPDLLKSSHKIGGVTFYISLYPEWLRLPFPVSLQDLDPQKLRFLKDSERTLSDFERQLHDIHTTFEVFESSIILTCCLTTDVPDAEHRADAWDAEVRSLCEQFFSSLSTEQMYISPEIWSDVFSAIDDLQMLNSDEAVLNINPGLNLVVVVGHNIITEPLMQELKDIKETATKHYKYRTDPTRRDMTATLWQLRLLKMMDFERLMSEKYPNLKTELVFHKNTIIFSGVMCDVDPACNDLEDTMSAFRQERLCVLSEGQYKLVQRRCVREYIDKKLEDLKGIFETGNGEVRVYSLPETDSRCISDVFRHSLREQVISLDTESVPLVESAEWKELCCDLTRPHGEGFEIIVGPDKSHVVVVATDDVIEDVTKDVKTIINNNSVYRDTIQFSIRDHRFLTTYKRSDIDNLARSYFVKHHKVSQGFSLEGTKDGVKNVKEELKTLSEAIVSKRCMFHRPGIVKLILSQKGCTQTQRIAANERCIIELQQQQAVSNDVKPTDASGGTLPHQSGNMRGGDVTRSVPGIDDQGVITHVQNEAGVVSTAPFEIVIIDGDITKQQTDVIVNSASWDLQLRNGSVSSSILEAAGEEIQQECDLKQIKPGEFAITSGGKLTCKHVYHACLPKWKEDTNRILRKVMLDCLENASQDAHKTIAFPALGTGNLEYPKEVVAHTMIETAHQFGQNNPESSLEKVSIVVHNDDTTVLEAFQRVKEKNDEEMKRKISFNIRRNNRVFDSDAIEGTTGQTPATQTSQPPRHVTLHIYSDNIRHVETAERLLDTFCKEAVTTQRISDGMLRTMNQQQQDKIRKLGLEHSVSVDFNQMLGTVDLEGLSSDVMEALALVHTTCMDIHLQQQRDERVQLISSYVRWGYIDLSGTGAVCDYDENINQKIEEAYLDKKDTLHLPVIDGNEYVLDFKKMEELDLNNPEDRVRVVRKHLGEGRIFETPSYWSPMKTESEMFELKKETTDYTKVEEAFTNSVGRQVTILKIERVQAQLLWKLYVMKRQHLEKPGVKVENILWHGTSVDATPCIAKNGFNRSYSGKNATAFGKGVYFAVSPSISDKDKYSEPDSEGRKHVFQARVLTGRYCKGAEVMTVPPIRDSENQIFYDSVVDNTEDPNMFIIFHDAHAYPEYLITYH